MSARHEAALKLIAEAHSCGDDCSDYMKMVATLALGRKPSHYEQQRFIDACEEDIRLATPTPDPDPLVRPRCGAPDGCAPVGA